MPVLVKCDLVLNTFIDFHFPLHKIWFTCYVRVATTMNNNSNHFLRCFCRILHVKNSYSLAVHQRMPSHDFIVCPQLAPLLAVYFYQKHGWEE